MLRLKGHEKPLAMAPRATFATSQPFGAPLSTFWASFEPLGISDRRTRKPPVPSPGQFAWTAGRHDPVAARSRCAGCNEVTTLFYSPKRLDGLDISVGATIPYHEYEVEFESIRKMRVCAADTG